MSAHAASSTIDEMLAGLPGGERRSLAEVFLRAVPLLRRMVEDAPAQVLKESLGAPSSTRSFWRRGRHLEHLGGGRAPEVSRQAVDKRRRRGTLLTVEIGDNHQYPLCQFDASGIVKHSAEVLQAMETESGWTKLSLLFSPTLEGEEQTLLWMRSRRGRSTRRCTRLEAGAIRSPPEPRHRR